MPLAALTQMMSPGSSWQPAARSFLRFWRFEAFTLSCLVAMMTWGKALARSHSSIWTSSLVGPISPSTSTRIITSCSRVSR